MSEPLREVQECPHCGEPTLANRLADGSLVCSCPASRLLGGLRLVPGPTRPKSRGE